MSADGVPTVSDQDKRRMAEVWGGCPECRGTNGSVNIDGWWWFFCQKHKTRWRRNVEVGDNWVTKLVNDFRVVTPLCVEPPTITEPADPRNRHYPLSAFAVSTAKVAQDEPCGICAQPIRPSEQFQMRVHLVERWRPVCESCSSKHAPPVLAAARLVNYANTLGHQLREIGADSSIPF